MLMTTTEYKHSDVPLLYQKIYEEFLKKANGNNVLSISAARKIMGLKFYIKKKEARDVLKEMREYGLIQFRSNNYVVLRGGLHD